MTSGQRITKIDGKWHVPDQPIVCFIQGDGIGPEVWGATRKTVDRAVEKTYGGKRKICWEELQAGQKALNEIGELLPQATKDKIVQNRVCIKGPLMTPIGGGHRSLNVTMRQEFKLFSCIRPVRYYPGVASPMKAPENVDMVVFRENIEDIYVGIEWPSGSDKVKKVIDFLNQEMGTRIPAQAGVGIKYMTREGTHRIMRVAMQYAVDNNKQVVTITHKGNIMKYTEGSFKEWAYELAQAEFGDRIILEKDLPADRKVPAGKILVNDRIADNMFQQLLINPEHYQVICAPNLNGDYLSDALAAEVGGLGMSPGANIGDDIAIFEATHGTAPDVAGMNVANPSSLILSAVMMLNFMGWKEAAKLLEDSLAQVLLSKTVTVDLAKNIPDAKKVGTSEFADRILDQMK